MPLINCEIILDLNWSKNCVIVANNANQDTTFSITNTKVYLQVVTLSTQVLAKLLDEQLKSGLKRTIKWNKHQPKISTEIPNQYLDYLMDPSLQGVNRLFVLSLEYEAQRASYKGYYLPTVKIKNYNVMIDG